MKYFVYRADCWVHAGLKNKYSTADTSTEDGSLRIKQIPQTQTSRMKNQEPNWPMTEVQKKKVTGALMLTLGSLVSGDWDLAEITEEKVFGFQDEDGGSLLTKQAPN